MSQGSIVQWNLLVGNVRCNNKNDESYDDGQNNNPATSEGKKQPTADKNLHIKRVTSTSSLRHWFLQSCVLASARPTQESKPINLIEIKNMAINYNWWNTNCFSPHIRGIGTRRAECMGEWEEMPICTVDFRAHSNRPIIFRAANRFY